jgi:hypothetical protein
MILDFQLLATACRETGCREPESSAQEQSQEQGTEDFEQVLFEYNRQILKQNRRKVNKNSIEKKS